LVLLILAVASFGAGGSNTMWWAEDRQGLALLCFYRVLESFIAGLPVAAWIIRIIRYATGRTIAGHLKWIGIAAIIGFFVWFTCVVDPLMCHI
jgi:hypothetical protein